MLTVLSPAKSLNLERSAATPRATRPRHLDRAETLVEALRPLSAARLSKLMKVSPAIAELNVERFAAWRASAPAAAAHKALLMFDGDVYRGLDVGTFDRDDFAFAQGHLRILSGLYGVLRPLDLALPYRLEMGTALKTGGAKDLYGFWGDAPAEDLRRDLRGHDARVVVNLASDEYFRAVRAEALGVPVVKPVFKEERDGSARVISFLAKHARGLMAGHIVRRRIDDPEALKSFTGGGYRYRPRLSTDREWVFTRPARPAKTG